MKQNYKILEQQNFELDTHSLKQRSKYQTTQAVCCFAHKIKQQTTHKSSMPKIPNNTSRLLLWSNKENTKQPSTPKIPNNTSRLLLWSKRQISNKQLKQTTQAVCFAHRIKYQAKSYNKQNASLLLLWSNITSNTQAFLKARKIYWNRKRKYKNREAKVKTIYWQTGDTLFSTSIHKRKQSKQNVEKFKTKSPEN